MSKAAGYKVYVGYDADLQGTPTDVGKPAAGSDGIIRHWLTHLTVGPTVHVSMTAYASDGSESLLSNGRTLTYAQVASVIDIDGDGLTHAQEDKNLNRKRDAGETDPRVFDTDGDGVSDGVEEEAGTNPLDPGSVSLCTGPCASALWLDAAGDANRYFGVMTADGRYAANKDLDTKANALTPIQVFANSTTNALVADAGDTVQYNIVLPSAGTWYLWARLYYPGKPGSYDANSFFVRVDKGPGQKLGNNADKFRVWHWDGSGDVEVGGPVALNLGVLPAGSHKLYIDKREVTPTQPRLDVVVLTRSATYIPNDPDAKAVLSGGSTFSASIEPLVDADPAPADGEGDPAPARTCSAHEDCDDEVSCTIDRCDPESGKCVSHAFDALCEDGDACNGREVCDASGGCVVLDGLSCDDGLICNGAETCDPARGCLAGTRPSCEDGIECTDDHCVEEMGGCKSFALDVSCDDGNGCTDDRCTTSGCAYDQSAAACDDGLSCTVDDRCHAGVCGGRDSCRSGHYCDAAADACTAVPGDPDDDGLAGDSDPCPLEVRNSCAGPVAVDANTGFPIRINAYGGDEACGGLKVDCNGEMWMDDFGYGGLGRPLACDLEGAGGAACTIAGVEDLFGCTSEATQDLLRCARGSASEGQSVSYDLAVPDGRYVVNLLLVGFDEDGERGDAQLRALVFDVRDGNGLQVSVPGAENVPAGVAAIEVLSLEK